MVLVGPFQVSIFCDSVSLKSLVQTILKLTTRNKMEIRESVNDYT